GSADLLLLPCRGLFRGLRWLLLVLVTDLVKTDIDDVSVEFRPRRQRKTQALLDIDEWHVSLAGCNGYRNPLELGRDRLRLRAFAHDSVAQGNVDLPRSTHGPEDDAALDADLDAHCGALHCALAGGLAERKLVAQIAGGRLSSLGGDIQGRRAGADIDPRAFEIRRRWSWRVRLSDARRCAGEKACDPAGPRGRVIGGPPARREVAAGQHCGTRDQRRRAARGARWLTITSRTH